MRFKKLLLSTLLLGGITLSAGAQSIPEPVLGISFTNNGITLSGSDASSGTHATTSKGIATCYDAITNRYVGSTSNASNSYYAINYDADDAVGQAFADECTWELLYRPDKQEAFSYTKYTTDGAGKVTAIADNSSGTTKFFSGQQSGGWSMYNYSNTGVQFQYVGNNGNVTTASNKQILTTGKFYHIIVSKSASKLTIYVNGQQINEVNITSSLGGYKHPDIGTTKRSKAMWFCLGGDPGTYYQIGTTNTASQSNTPDRVENSAQATWVFANIYNRALTQANVASLYNDEVRHFTEPKKIANDLIVDAVFGKNGVARDASSVGTLKKAGTPTTIYDEDLNKYVLTSGETVSNANFYYTYFGMNPQVSSALGDAMTIEFYAKAKTDRSTTPYASMAAVSAYQGGGFGSHISNSNTNVPFTAKYYGYHVAGTNSSGTKYNAGCKSWGGYATASGKLKKGEYAHYVFVRDRENGIQKVYIDGELVADGNQICQQTNNQGLNAYDNQEFPVTLSQWIAIGGDANGKNASTGVPADCDFPWQGEIATARVWSKALTEEEIISLKEQNTQTTATVTTNAAGYATVYLPFAAIIPAGLTAYGAKDAGNNRISLVKIANAGEILAAETPVILKGDASTDYSLDVGNTSSTNPKSMTGNLLLGTLIGKTFTTGTASTLNGDQFESALTTSKQTAFIAEGGTKTIILAEDAIADGEAIIDIAFTKEGIVNKGKEQHEVASNDIGTASIYNADKDSYLGSTNANETSYYYLKYDKNDALGQAFANGCTWETVVRFDKWQGFNNGGGSNLIKFFSSQDDGGWSMYHTSTSGKIGFDYVSTGATKSAAQTTPFLLKTGQFYHIAATLDKTNKELTLYINGNEAGKVALDSNPFKYPNCGTTVRENGMWLCLGGDPNNAAAPAKCQNSGRCTFALARVYKGMKDINDLYNEEVKYFTEPNNNTTTDLILDAVFENGGNAHDASATKSLVKAGNPKTGYNEDQKRYQLIGEQNTKNFFYQDYGQNPYVTSVLGDAISYEFYCQPSTTTPSATMCVISSQQDGGSGADFISGGTFKFFACNYGLQPKEESGEAAPNAPSKDGATHVGVENVEATKAYDTNWNHYVVIYDRKNRKDYIYINGQLDKEEIIGKYDYARLPFATYQWFAVGGDASATTLNRTVCDFPFKGNISIARVWGKALTEEDVQALYTQATTTSKQITIGASGYSTTILPFAAIVPEGITAYIVSSETSTTVETEVYANAGDVMPYGIPVILKGVAGETYTFEAADLTNATILPAPATNLLEGSFATKDVKENEIYALASDGSFKLVNTGTTPTQKAWLPFTTGSAASKKFAAGAITKINNIQNNSQDNLYYDIQGNRVEKPTRGIYIKNGKKVFVR